MSPLLPAAVAALLELDAAHVAQLLVSRPLVMGPAVGWCAGSVTAGVAAGLAFELFSLAGAPIGGKLSWSAPVAAAVGALVGASRPDGGLWLPAGLAAGWAHARVEELERRARARWAAAAAQEARDGREPRYGRYLAASAGAHALATFGLVLGAGALFGAANAALYRADGPFAFAAPVLWLVGLHATTLGLARLAVAGMRGA